MPTTGRKHTTKEKIRPRLKAMGPKLKFFLGDIFRRKSSVTHPPVKAMLARIPKPRTENPIDQSLSFEGWWLSTQRKTNRLIKPTKPTKRLYGIRLSSHQRMTLNQDLDPGWTSNNFPYHLPIKMSPQLYCVNHSNTFGMNLVQSLGGQFLAVLYDTSKLTGCPDQNPLLKQQEAVPCHIGVIECH